MVSPAFTSTLTTSPAVMFSPSSGILNSVGISRFAVRYQSQSTPNSQLPTPRESLEPAGSKAIQPARRNSATPLFEQFPLGVGSWKLGVVMSQALAGSRF